MSILCSNCNPRQEMPILTLEQTPDYTVGWQCDDCAFRSTVNSELPRSRQRFHCTGCSEDICILCGRKRAQQMGGTAPVIPELPMSLPANELATTLRIEPDDEHMGHGGGDEGVDNNDDGLSSDENEGEGRWNKSDPAAESASTPGRSRQMRMSESWSDRVRKDEESSHAAWFSAAKKQWLESGKRSDVPDAFLDGAKRGSRTVIVAQEDDNEIASVPTMVDVEIPSFTKAPAGHVVYNVKVVDRESMDTWTVLKRYSEFRNLYKRVRRGFKYSKYPDDLKLLLPFPQKETFPDCERRRKLLERWLQDLVSKVSMHVCDDASAREASLFLGLKATAYLDIPEDRADEPVRTVTPPPVPVIRLPSHNSEVTITREAGKGSANLEEIAASMGSPNSRGSGGGSPSSTKRSPVPGRASTLANEVSVRLYEAGALYEEGLIGETDLIFARKGIVDDIIRSEETPINKLREANALVKKELITASEYDEVKSKVLSAAQSPLPITGGLGVGGSSAAGGLSRRSSPHSSEYGSVQSIPC
eukprot:m.37076 g.37076  ORF g.37076 m.37076 type:complete len:532 (+) comp5474_c0_seq1:608-2203(+)